jgi:hypothetical protein
MICGGKAAGGSYEATRLADEVRGLQTRLA